jgi:uncharacterized Zn-binding protein involved in type VI secretion
MAAPIGRMGDIAGGALFGPRIPSIFANGRNIAVVGTPITPHGRPPHSAAVMVTGSPTVLAGAGFIPVCRAGDVASCGDVLISTSTVIVGP